MKNKHSEYIIYVDESGDHGLKNINKDYPIFVLTFCSFKKEEYINNIVPKLQKLKFDYFGHDQIILHEHPIRKQKEEFAFLRANADLRKNFLTDINNFIENINFEIVTVIIDKERLKKQYKEPINPYYLGVQFGVENIYSNLLHKQQVEKEVHFIFEKRGKKEDDELELEFRRICNSNGSLGYKKTDFSKMKLTQLFADKKSNSTGLQIADLVSRPVGLNYLRPNQNNRAYDIFKNKIKVKKVFPLKNKKP